MLHFREVHGLGVPAYLEVDVLFARYVDTEDLIAQSAQLEYGYGDGPPRIFTGLVESVTVRGTSGVGGSDRTYQ